ncbi:MAG: HTH-type transcriptional repressor CarH [Myxococcales bacterium]
MLKSITRKGATRAKPAAAPPAPEARVTAEVLSTRQVAQLLGVGEATVKRWADSGEIDCFRTPGGHRKFRLGDVTAFVQKRQYEVAGRLQSPLADGEADSVGEAVQALEKYAMRGDAGACVALMSMLRLKGHSLADIFDDVVAPALRTVGTKWEKCSITIAEEHVATQTVVEAIARAQPLAEPPGEPNRADRGTAVVASVSGDQHDVAARMAACLLRARCFEVLAPLAQTPARDLAEMIVRARASIVALACTIPQDVRSLIEQIELAEQATRQTGGILLVGGPGMEKVQLPQGARRLGSMRQLVAESEPAGRRRASRDA